MDPGSKSFSWTGEPWGFYAFIVRSGDQVVGFLDECPHTGWSLTTEPDRYLTADGRNIICTGHGALFRLADGECLGGPCYGRALTPWPVAVRDGDVFTA